MKTTILVLALLALAAPGVAQTTYSLELSAAGYLNSTPHSAGDATIVVGPNTGRLASYSTIEVRPVTLKSPTTVPRSGAQWTVASNGKLELALLGQLGVANGASTSLAGAMGGKVSFHPGWSKAPGLYFVLVGQGLGMSSALGGWETQASMGVGYTLTGFGSGTLTARRRLAAANRRAGGN